MSRPADWTPLADSDPVPGDPTAVAMLGYQLQQTAAQIQQDVAYLRSLCTDEFWESDAGSAFQGRADSTADKLWQAHYRYMAAGEALGSDLAGTGYAPALHEAQALSLRALAQGQEAWSAMRQALAAVSFTSDGIIPYEGSPAIGYTDQPELDGSGSPIPITPSPRDKPETTAAIRAYNARAADYSAAIALLNQAIIIRNDAADSAASRILGAISADGLQDPTGFLHDLESAWDDAAGWASHNWARIVADIANVCGWIATVCGLLALVFAFIPLLQPLAAILEGVALTMTEISLICHVILAATGNGSWLEVGFDMIALATFGEGRALLRSAQGTVEIADRISATGAAARADVWAQGLEASDGVMTEITRLAETATRAERDTMSELGAKVSKSLPKWLGDVDKSDFNPVNPATAWHTLMDTDWKEAFSEGTVKVLKAAMQNGFRLQSPEIAEAMSELKEVPQFSLVSELSGIPFQRFIASYGTRWTADQSIALGTDTLDKLNGVVEHFGGEIPPLHWLEGKTTT